MAGKRINPCARLLIPSEKNKSIRTIPLKCGKAKRKERNLPFVVRINTIAENQLLPASLRGRVILGKGKKMQKRKFDELISHFNRNVSDMSIDRKYKIELLGMISAIGFAHEEELSTNLAEVGTDCISRQAAIDALHMHLMYRMGTDSNKKRLDDWINGVPSVQPERTCVNCGRTANNGGWYADGRTRCPIEEHYALPKDGYCHLWEKRNVTDDDYPERREE